jgi:hypothetical protein
MPRLIREVGPRSDLSLSMRLHDGAVLPVVGASVSYDLIFAADQGRLAQSWAEKLDLPHDERDPVCRVARYQFYRSGDDLRVKEGYLLFLKETLLNQAKVEGVDHDIVEEAASQMDDVSFTEFAARLGYPRRDDPRRDPLLLLAHLPLRFYVTTSFHGFLQNALQWSGRNPRTVVCLWNEAAANLVRPKQRFDSDYQPTVQDPFVFHVYGHDEYPESLVLSEEDYLWWLESVAQGSGNQATDSIPAIVRGALASYRLYLGFRPDALEFRAFWLGLSSPNRPDRRGTFQCSHLPEQAVFRQYHEQYLANRGLDVYWGTASNLLRELNEL